MSLARALISKPELLLLDEPFGALDALSRITAQQLLLDTASSRNFGILLVTHDVAEITVGLPTPRDRSNPQFVHYTAELLRLLKVTS